MIENTENKKMAGVPYSDDLKERFEKWFSEDANIQGAPRAMAYQAFLAGVNAKADQLTVKQLEEDLAAMESRDVRVMPSISAARRDCGFDLSLSITVE